MVQRVAKKKETTPTASTSTTGVRRVLVSTPLQKKNQAEMDAEAARLKRVREAAGGAITPPATVAGGPIRVPPPQDIISTLLSNQLAKRRGKANVQSRTRNRTQRQQVGSSMISEADKLG